MFFENCQIIDPSSNQQFLTLFLILLLSVRKYGALHRSSDWMGRLRKRFNRIPIIIKLLFPTQNHYENICSELDLFANTFCTETALWMSSIGENISKRPSVSGNISTDLPVVSNRSTLLIRTIRAIVIVNIVNLNRCD